MVFCARLQKHNKTNGFSNLGWEAMPLRTLLFRVLRRQGAILLWVSASNPADLVAGPVGPHCLPLAPGQSCSKRYKNRCLFAPWLQKQCKTTVFSCLGSKNAVKLMVSATLLGGQREKPSKTNVFLMQGSKNTIKLHPGVEGPLNNEVLRGVVSRTRLLKPLVLLCFWSIASKKH